MIIRRIIVTTFGAQPREWNWLTPLRDAAEKVGVEVVEHGLHGPISMIKVANANPTVPGDAWVRCVPTRNDLPKEPDDWEKSFLEEVGARYFSADEVHDLIAQLLVQSSS